MLLPRPFPDFRLQDHCVDFFHLEFQRFLARLRGSMMSEKKRKTQTELNSQPSRKKSPIAAINPLITVRYLKSRDLARPVVGILSLLHNWESA